MFVDVYNLLRKTFKTLNHFFGEHFYHGLRLQLLLCAQYQLPRRSDQRVLSEAQ